MSPAECVIEAFFGIRAAARALGVEPSTVYRWNQSKQRGGTGGRVPTEHWSAAIKAAARLGRNLTEQHLTIGKPGIERRVIRRL